MDITIQPGLLKGSLSAIPSKSQAHRLLICAAFADSPTTLICPDTNEDIEATAACLNALGAVVSRTEQGYHVQPATAIPYEATLPVNESGSTLRFLLPVVGSLGVDALFQMKGRLPQRPLSPLWEEMERMGCSLSRPSENTLRCSGKLRSGTYRIDGSVSSQFITGLLFAASIMDGESCIALWGKTESKPYIVMTQRALALFGIECSNFCIPKDHKLISPGRVTVEGDWSNAAFFLAARTLGAHICVENLNYESPQGDRKITQILPAMDQFLEIDAADIPDLVPILAVTAAAKQGARFTNIERLRLKESDRVQTVAAMLERLGVSTEITQSTLTVYPGSFRGCTVDAAGDHRIAMAAAIAATVANGPVTILGAQCVKKSYPSFWEEYRKLGGNYELNIR